MNTRTLGTRVLIAACTAAIAAGALGQNLTVGDDSGGDHIAFTFAPYLWAGASGEADYRRHVSSGPGSGQQYGHIAYTEAAAPGAAVPGTCTVARLYTIIHDETSFLGTLLITTHGGTNKLSIEPFAKTAAGLAARDTRYDAYIAGTTGIAGLPAFTAAEIYKSSNDDAYAVGITSTFVRNHGRLTRGLVYIGACKGGTMADDFVAGNARVALGENASFSCGDIATDVRTFFSRMDGKFGQRNRPAGPARAGLPVTMAGAQNTTLAPSVLWLRAPCPIATGDIVTVKLDTTCEVGIIPDLEGAGCTIENEMWLDNVTLRGTCTAPPPPGAFAFSITLKWGNTYSDQNVARLDGNTNPARNAEGPAHDDYRQPFICARRCRGDVTGDGVVNVFDLLVVLGDWGACPQPCPPSCPGDVNGDCVVNVFDLLAVLAEWGPCPAAHAACCLPDGLCVDVTEPECVDLGGVSIPGTICVAGLCPLPEGACCLGGGSCLDAITEEACNALDGGYQGSGTICAAIPCPQPIGACCLPDGFCQDGLDPDGCTALGGGFVGGGSDCRSSPCFGACCLPDGTCVEAPPLECQSIGGTYAGHGVPCGVAECENGPGREYCPSGAASPVDSIVGEVFLNTIANATAGQCATYSDFTAISTDLQPGQGYELVVTADDCDGGGCFTRGVGVWIDWNADGQFDPGEQVLSALSNQCATTHVAPLLVPFTAQPGPTRMRVVVTEDPTNVQPCGQYQWGETEDYTVNVVP